MIDINALRSDEQFRALPLSTRIGALRFALAENATNPAPRQPSAQASPGVRLDQKIQSLGLDPSLVYGIVSTEGSGNQAISPRGAVGRFQVMPATAAAYGVSRADLRDPARNEDAGLAYIQDLTRRYKGYENWPDLVRAAYFSGPGNVHDGRIVDPRRTDGNITVAEYVQRARQHSARWARQQGGTLAGGTPSATRPRWDAMAPAYYDPRVQALSRREQAQVLATLRMTGKLEIPE